MATGKLTKGRLAQIAITLLVLIAAFTWRTYTYTNQMLVVCTGTKPCHFQNGNHIVSVSYVENNELSYYELSPWLNNWFIDTKNKFEIQKGVLLVFSNGKNVIELEINDYIKLKIVIKP